MQAASPAANLNRSLAIGLLLGFLVLMGLALFGDLHQFNLTVLEFRWSLYPLVFILTLFNYSLRFIKWHYYLKLIGVRGLALRESARLFVGGFPLAVTPGKAGEVVKALWLKEMTGLPAARGVAVVAAERISDGLAVLALSTVGVIAYPQYWPIFAAVLAFLLAVLIISQTRPLALALLQFAEQLPFLRRLVHPLRDFYEGSYVLFRPKPAAAAVSLGTISWLGEGTGFYLILVGLGQPPGWHTLSIAVFVLAFSILVGAVSTLPGGLGASEASIAGMLTLLVSMPAGESAAATLLIRFATLWFGVALGLLVWVFSRRMLGLAGGS